MTVLLWDKPINGGDGGCHFPGQVVGFDIFRKFRRFEAHFPGESWPIHVRWVVEVRWGKSMRYLRDWDVSAEGMCEGEEHTESVRREEAVVNLGSAWALDQE